MSTSDNGESAAFGDPAAFAYITDDTYPCEQQEAATPPWIRAWRATAELAGLLWAVALLAILAIIDGALAQMRK